MSQTPLEQLGELTSQQREELAGQWIHSVEALQDALAALPAGAARTDLLAQPTWAATCQRLAAWNESTRATKPQPHGGFGLRIPPAVLSRLALGRPRVLPNMRLTGEGDGPALPSSVNWISRFPVVRNQGARGTCVAFASTALREYVGDFQSVFSEQFCYWACKSLDGDQQEGTTLAMATTALERLGACPAPLWPYSSERLPGNEGHHPPPAAAVNAAREHRVRDWRLLNGQDVHTLKEVLAGRPGIPGSPVVIGVAVFASSFDSARAYTTGEITLPFPTEVPTGGHAMCAVGYVDDASVPGGGYFVVRNSWGPEWAARNRYAPGYALLPYAYVAYACFEAFAAPAHRLENSTRPRDAFDEFLRTRPADSAATDRREWLNYRDAQPLGNRLPDGETVAVLVQPALPQEFRRDTPENRDQFLRQWCAWSEAGADLAAQAVLEALPESTQRRLSLARRERERHLGALDSNLAAAVGTPFPFLHEPWFLKLVPYEWEPPVRSVRQVADLTEAVLELWENRQRPSASPAWPASVRRLWRETNGVRVYELTGGGQRVHVVTGWFTPLTYRRDHQTLHCTLLPSDPVLAQLAREAHAAWCQATRITAAEFVFHSFGYLGPCEALPPELTAVVSSTHSELYWSRDARGDWVTSLPDRAADRLSLRDFLDRLIPITQRERVSRVKAVVDALREEGYGGRITVALVQRRTGTREQHSGGAQSGYRLSVVFDAFLKLQDESPDRYRVEKAHPRDELSRSGLNLAQVRVVLPSAHDGEQVTSASVRRRFLRRHGLGLLGALISCGIPALVAEISAGAHLRPWQSLLAAAGGFYVGNLINKALHRHADRSAG